MDATRLPPLGGARFPCADAAATLRQLPLATYALLALNLILFLYQATLTTDRRTLFILRWAAIPVEITEWTDLQPTVPAPIPLTLLSALFLHIDLLHLGGNLFYLWVFGEPIERALGRVRFLLLYLLCGIGAALVHLAMNATSLIPLVGASGAIAGLMAATLVLSPRLTVRTLIVGAWLAAQLTGGLVAFTVREQSTGGMALWAHVGGWGGGLILAVLSRIYWRPYPGRKADPGG